MFSGWGGNGEAEGMVVVIGWFRTGWLQLPLLDVLLCWLPAMESAPVVVEVVFAEGKVTMKLSLGFNPGGIVQLTVVPSGAATSIC